MDRRVKNRKVFEVVLSVFLVLTTAGIYLYNLGFPTQIILQKEIDLKEIQLSEKPVFSVKIINVSNTNVEIARIYTSCGCTTVLEPTDSFDLKPKSIRDIKVQFNPSSMHKSGDNVYHEIYILTTKPLEKEYMVKMIGRIV